MNGINSIQNGYNHLKALSSQNNDLSYNLKTGINNVLPSITNLNNVSADISFNSYLNSDSILMSNNVVSHPSLMMNDYGNGEYSLPAIRGFSHMNNGQYYPASTTNNGFTPHQNCSQPDIQYQDYNYNYNPIVPDTNWIESSYPNESLKQQPIVTFPRHSYPPNGISHSSPMSDSKITISKSSHGKDEKYSVRRHKNNIAAKKCRDNKKMKNQEVCDLIQKYEKENDDLKLQIHSVKSKIEELVKQLRATQR